MKRLIVIAAALAIAGCATAPEEIEPRDTDPRLYMAFSCAELEERATAVDIELQDYVASQHHSRVADALTWPIPTTRIFGKNSRNVEAIARLRGELAAMAQAQSTKQCPRTP